MTSSGLFGDRFDARRQSELQLGLKALPGSSDPFDCKARNAATALRAESGAARAFGRVLPEVLLNPAPPAPGRTVHLPGRHLLIVRGSKFNLPRSAALACEGGPITLLSSDGLRRSVELKVAPSYDVFSMTKGYVNRACGRNPHLKARHGASSKKISALADRIMIAEGNEEASEAVRATLWVALARSVSQVFGDLTLGLDDTWLNPSALQRVAELVEERIASRITMTMLEAEAGLSPTAFLRAFRGSTGMTPKGFVIQRRLERAAQLLVRTALPISSVARSVGFRSSNHFATSFRIRRGCSPSMYRSSYPLL